jgi:hypothetical protein
MKLAEALALRSDLQTRLAQLKERAIAVARYQEGEEPAEVATDLLAQARSICDEIEDLVRRVNRTNSSTEIADGLTITDAIAGRDNLALKRRLVTSVADAAAGHNPNANPWERQLRSELRQITDVPVSQLRSEADDLARRYRELDVRIQEANWATELID